MTEHLNPAPNAETLSAMDDPGFEQGAGTNFVLSDRAIRTARDRGFRCFTDDAFTVEHPISKHWPNRPPRKHG